MIIVSLGWLPELESTGLVTATSAGLGGAGTGFMAMVSRKIMKIG